MYVCVYIVCIFTRQLWLCIFSLGFNRYGSDIFSIFVFVAAVSNDNNDEHFF